MSDTPKTIPREVVVAATNFKPWMLTLLLFLAGQTCAAVWWASSVNEKVKTVVSLEQKFHEVTARVDTALGVLKDHGTEFTSVRSQIARLQGVDESIRAEINSRYRDRFTGDNWESAKQSLDERRISDLRIHTLEHEQVIRRLSMMEKATGTH